ncbi:hypothetical protein RM577_03360 [Mammaliicoccus sciuri]|uniref:hypothetical protein n=1 Tax=Mammaliicoccus sciuri TaxID=1296 RepID=UPI0028886F99|nr:hypothetical protein [Mammaliicoccus sciuri]MDT0707326.1 hypothetical protein [Mammaliicoccus sciuri]
MKIRVKAQYTTYAVVEIDARDWESAGNELEKLEKHFPYEFLDTNKITLEDTELIEIVEGYKYVR